MYTISKQFQFSASHLLDGLPVEHPCGRLHGHNYVVEIVLESQHLDHVGFVRDYKELGLFKDYIDTTLDHQHLNFVLDFQPSAENLARHFFDWCRQRWPEVAAARVSETEKTWAEYRP